MDHVVSMQTNQMFEYNSVTELLPIDYFEGGEDSGVKIGDSTRYNEGDVALSIYKTTPAPCPSAAFGARLIKPVELKAIDGEFRLH